jgi:acyl-CoA thioester hydrolase
MTERGFRFETSIDVRFRDLDLMGWTHNSVLLVYVEEARILYFRKVFDTKLEEIDGAIVHQEIDYESPVNYGQDVTVYHRVNKIGKSSLTAQFRVESNGEIAAEGEVTYVVLDEEGTPRQIPPDWKHKICSFEPAEVEVHE